MTNGMRQLTRLIHRYERDQGIKYHKHRVFFLCKKPKFRHTHCLIYPAAFTDSSCEEHTCIYVWLTHLSISVILSSLSPSSRSRVHAATVRWASIPIYFAHFILCHARAHVRKYFISDTRMRVIPDTHTLAAFIYDVSYYHVSTFSPCNISSSLI